MNRNYNSQFVLEQEARRFMDYAMHFYALSEKTALEQGKSRLEKLANKNARMAERKYKSADHHRRGIWIWE